MVIKYELNDNHMFYANYSEGTLPGGFNPEVADKLTTPDQISTFNADTPGIGETFQEETLKNYEAGWKYSSDDGRVAMNIALFHMERSDQIYSGFGVIPADINCAGDSGDGTPVTETCTVAFSGNGTSSDIDGFEVDLSYMMLDNLRLQAALGYTKAEISDFPETGDCGDYNDVFGPGLSSLVNKRHDIPSGLVPLSQHTISTRLLVAPTREASSSIPVLIMMRLQT